ncbi:MAG: tRNA (adenosine(37)-N6)-dimethylallyltransferase MiaA [Actinomycetota bacterium]
MSLPRVLAVVGPTASGKSAFALEVAQRLNAEIVSMDSALVYRGMDIGTDKPSPEQLARVPHHLVDIVEPSETVTVADFQALARGRIAQILTSGRTPLLVGGSGLYFRAVVDPLEFPGTDPAVRSRLEAEAQRLGGLAMYERLRAADPAAAAAIDVPNVRRTIRALEVIEVTGRPFSAFRTGWDHAQSLYRLTVAGLTAPRPELDRRIAARVESQIARGLVDEVRHLLNVGLRASVTSVQAIGYAQVLAYLDGRFTLEEAMEEIRCRTRRFARRQERWFKADPRVVWFSSDVEGAAAYLLGG